MTLLEAVQDLDGLGEEQTIYAAMPWKAISLALVLTEPESGELPAEARESGLAYFVEVAVAREFLDGWMASSRDATDAEKCARLIHYASDDA